MFEIAAPPGIVASLLAGPHNVRVEWSLYDDADNAGHQVIGYRLYRSTTPLSLGTLVADEGTLIPSTRYFDDMGEPVFGEVAYYTLFAVEPNDFGSRPYGEGGNVPYGV